MRSILWIQLQIKGISVMFHGFIEKNRIYLVKWDAVGTPAEFWISISVVMLKNAIRFDFFTEKEKKYHTDQIILLKLLK